MSKITIRSYSTQIKRTIVGMLDKRQSASLKVFPFLENRQCL